MQLMNPMLRCPNRCLGKQAGPGNESRDIAAKYVALKFYRVVMSLWVLLV